MVFFWESRSILNSNLFESIMHLSPSTLLISPQVYFPIGYASLSLSEYHINAVLHTNPKYDISLSVPQSSDGGEGEEWALIFYIQYGHKLPPWSWQTTCQFILRFSNSAFIITGQNSHISIKHLCVSHLYCPQLALKLWHSFDLLPNFFFQTSGHKFFVKHWATTHLKMKISCLLPT